MAKQRSNQRTADPGASTWVGLHQLEKWKREAAKPSYVAAGFKILHSAGKITRLDYLNLMREMETQFPGLGWKPAYDDIERFFFDHSLLLAHYPIMRSLGLKHREPGEEG